MLDQDGTKRYVHGPDVVFPRPTEKFIEAPIKSNPDKVKAKKFRAQELTPMTGIHIRVIADHVEDDGTERKAGEELFITGKQQTIYYPREEHAIIKYGEQDIHYGVAIPVGEARYVLDRESGSISLVKGPQVFLPDPRKQVIVQRALALKLCELLYPGNSEAIMINAARLEIDSPDIVGAAATGLNVLDTGSTESSSYMSANTSAYGVAVTPDTTRRIAIKGASKSLPGDSFDRKNKFTPPRSIILNTKYDGAVSVDVWSGHAMLIVKKTGERRVVIGPQTALLEYDETPQVLTLSTGKPKNMDKPFKTVYLSTTANMVSDIINVETKDFIKLDLKVSYRVNFEGDDPEKWFAIDNYVKYMTDHMRSRVRNAVQKLGIEEFYSSHTDIVRSVVLGSNKEGTRSGALFAENNMRIYDVEVLEAKILNKEIEALLVSAQRNAISHALELAESSRQLEHTIKTEEIAQLTEATRAKTFESSLAIASKKSMLKHSHDTALLEQQHQIELQKLQDEQECSEQKKAIVMADLERSRLVESQRIEFAESTLNLELKKIEAAANDVVKRAQAITPDLVAAMTRITDASLTEKIAETMAPMALLGGTSVVDVAKKLLDGTVLKDGLESIGETVAKKFATKKPQF